jgi:hypothetical protein
VTNPTLVPIGGYGVRVSWKLNWDPDDTALTYKVVRADQPSVPLQTVTYPSYFWQRPVVSYVDTTAQPDQTYRYRVTVADPNGNGTQSDYVSVTMPSTGLGDYSRAVLDGGAVNYWRLGDAGQTTLANLAGGPTLTKQSGVTSSSSSALSGDTDDSANFNGTSTGVARTSASVSGPQSFAVETWIKTTSTTGGKVIGFGNTATGLSSSYDRHVYMDNAGRITFGVRSGGVRTLTTAPGFNDGSWHHILAQLSPAGMALWVDGVQRGSNVGTTSAQAYVGYWRLG